MSWSIDDSKRVWNDSIATTAKLEEAIDQLSDEETRGVQTLVFDRCLRLQKLPHNLHRFTQLQVLSLRKCHGLIALDNLPATVKTLDLSYCLKLRSLNWLNEPIERLSLEGDNWLEEWHFPLHLKELNLRGLYIRSLPVLPRTVEYLYVGGTDIVPQLLNALKRERPSLTIDMGEPNSDEPIRWKTS